MIELLKFYGNRASRAALAITAFALLIAPSAFAADGPAENGRKIYMTHCYQCHGVEGKGDGPSAAYVPRRPRNFADGLYKLKTSSPYTALARDEDIFDAITQGMVVAGMPAWESTLTEQERWDVAAYLKSMSDLYEGQPDPEPLDMSGKTAPSPESVERGRKAYFEFKCYECHGETGSGPSQKELRDDYGMRIWPRDLTRPGVYIGPFTQEALYARVTNGIPLTPMPSRVIPGGEDTLEQARWDVVNYVMWMAGEAERKRRRDNAIGAVALALAGATVYFIYRRKPSKSAT